MILPLTHSGKVTLRKKKWLLNDACKVLQVGSSSRFTRNRPCTHAENKRFLITPSHIVENQSFKCLM